MNNKKLIQIAEIMIDATLNCVHKDIAKEIVNNHTLTCRIGSGKRTYYASSTNSITYGLKMIDSLMTKSSAKLWTHGIEITKRNYFNGEHTLQNMIIATILHEYSHYIQVVNGQATKGSIHNQHFYFILDKFYECEHHKVLHEYLSQYDIYNELEFKEEEKTVQYNKESVQGHQFIEFFDEGNNRHVSLKVLKCNPKKVYGMTSNMMAFNIHYEIITNATNEVPKDFEGKEHILNKKHFTKRQLDNFEYIEFIYRNEVLKGKKIKVKANMVSVFIEGQERNSVYEVPFGLISNGY